jgi:hypothetical protein
MSVNVRSKPPNGWLGWIRVQWDRCAAWIVIAVGVLVLILGWLGVSSTPYPAQQISYAVSGGLTGVCLLLFGGMLWLSADLRDHWFKLDRIEQELHRDQDRSAAGAPTDSAPADARTNGTGIHSEAVR